MAIKVKRFHKGASIDVSVPKPVDVDNNSYIDKNDNAYINKNTYAPTVENNNADYEAQVRENIYAPEEGIKVRTKQEEESTYAPELNVYVSNAYLDYAKSYLQMLLKMLELNNDE